MRAVSVTYRCKNLQKMKRFYSKILGWEITEEGPNGNAQTGTPAARVGGRRGRAFAADRAGKRGIRSCLDGNAYPRLRRRHRA